MTKVSTNRALKKDKPKKTKMIRDNFTIPEWGYAKFNACEKSLTTSNEERNLIKVLFKEIMK